MSPRRKNFFESAPIKTQNTEDKATLEEAETEIALKELGEAETAVVSRVPWKEEIAAEARKELAETSEILQQADRMTVELFDARIAEAGSFEEIQKIVRELNALLEIRETKPCEPPCRHLENFGDAHKGANQSYILRLAEHGKELAAIYKPAVGEEHGPTKDLGLRPGIERGSYYKREWLTYMVDRALEIGVVPPTALRREDLGIGSVQAWVEKAGTVLETPGFPNPEDLLKLALLDYLTGNQDRHKGNYLIDQEGGLYAIDNGLSFGPSLYDATGKKVFSALDVRSRPLEQAKEISKAIQRPLLELCLRKFIDSPQRQEILKKAFDFVLGKTSDEIWDVFMSRIKEVLRKGELPKDYSQSDAMARIKYGLGQEYLGATTIDKLAEAA